MNQDDLFSDQHIAQPEPPHKSPIAELQRLEPLTTFLIKFAKAGLGRFKDRHKREVIHALIEASGSKSFNAADALFWIEEEAPKAPKAYLSLPELAQRLPIEHRPIARRAALKIIGGAQSAAREQCRLLVAEIFGLS